MARIRVVVGLVAATLLAAGCGSPALEATTAPGPSELLDSIDVDDTGGSEPVDPITPSGSGDLAILAPGRNDITLGLADGTPLAVTILLPPGWTPGTVTPAILALPPGDQSKAMVEAVVGRYFTDATASAGWVVVTPAAPESIDAAEQSRLFYDDSGPLGELLDLLDGVVVAEDGRWHVAGPSNGGLSAFRFAVDDVDRVQSVIGLPGYATATNAAEVLVDIPVALYVGETDVAWREAMDGFDAELEAVGGTVDLVVSPGEGHVLVNVTPAQLLEVLEAARP